MPLIQLCFVAVLLASLILGLIRVMLGPTAADRMLAAQLTGTTGVAMLVLLARSLTQPALLDVALMFALLAGVAAVAFAQCYVLIERSRQR